jgi:hypothetical protein
MKVFLLICVMTTIGLAACGGGGGDCKTVACMTSANTYQLCGAATDATYKFGGTSCSCLSDDTAGCTSCAAKLSSYCATPMGGDGGSSGDLATGPDMTVDNSTCSIVGTFKGMVTGGNTATLTSTGTSTSGSFTFTVTPGTPTTYNTGNYEYSNDSITMTNASSSSTPSCMGMAEVLAVTWANQCKTVTFTKTSDACAGRTADLSGDTLAYAIVDMSL